MQGRDSRAPSLSRTINHITLCTLLFEIFDEKLFIRRVIFLNDAEMVLFLKDEHHW